MLNEFDGKAALDEGELVRTIKDAIKDGLKGLSFGGAAAAGAAEALAEAERPVAKEPEALSEDDEWGFKSKRAKNNDW